MEFLHSFLRSYFTGKPLVASWNFNCFPRPMCSSKNYPYLPQGRNFSLDPPPPPLWRFQSNFMHLIKIIFCRPLRTPPPHPQEIPIPSVGEVDIFWNYTIHAQNPKPQSTLGNHYKSDNCTFKYYLSLLQDLYLPIDQTNTGKVGRKLH